MGTCSLTKWARKGMRCIRNGYDVLERGSRKAPCVGA